MAKHAIKRQMTEQTLAHDIGQLQKWLAANPRAAPQDRVTVRLMIVDKTIKQQRLKKEYDNSTSKTTEAGR